MPSCWSRTPSFPEEKLGYLGFLEETVEAEIGQQADVSFFYLFHTLYVFALKIIQYYMRTVGLKEKITNIC